LPHLHCWLWWSSWCFG